MRVMTILAHPDDAEIWCGGTLLKHVAQGDEVAVCTFHTLNSQRLLEAKMGASTIGAVLFPVELESYLSLLSEEILSKLSCFLLEFKPHVAIIHWHRDSHPDHASACALARKSIVKVVGIIGFPNSVYECDTYNSLGLTKSFSPDVYIDITDVWESKLVAIQQHASQRPDRYVTMVEAQNRLHGLRCGVAFAEAYRRCFIGGQTGAWSTLL